MKTSGTDADASCRQRLQRVNAHLRLHLVTSVRNEPNSDTAAITAEPMAMPLVMALVVLPTASRSAMIWRALRFEAGHLADAVGVVGDRAEGVHRHVVAGQRQHADTGHRHAVEHEGRSASIGDRVPTPPKISTDDRIVKRDHDDRPHGWLS